MIELVRFYFGLRLRSTLTWAVAFGLVSLLVVASYTAIDVEQLEQMSQAFSSELLEAFGATAESIATPKGYLASQFLLMAPIALAFYPATGASRAIAGAEASGALDVVLGAPIPRWAVPIASWLASALGLVVIAAVYFVLTWVGTTLFGVDLPAGDLAISAVGLLPISLAFGAFATLVSTAVRSPGLVSAITGGLVVATYILQTLILVLPELESLRWLTPFHHYDSPIERGLSGQGTAILLGAAAVLLAAAIPVFARRDVRA